MKLFTEENIIKGIRKNDRRALDYVYNAYFYTAKRIIMKNKDFSEDDAWDIFQDSMVILLKKINEKMIFTCSVQTYIISLCNNIVLKRIEISQRQPEDLIKNINSIKEQGEFPEFYNENELTIIEELKYGLIYKQFNKLKRDCKKILKLFFNNASMKEISKKMGFSGENYARKRKHICMAYFMEMIRKDKQYNNIQKKLQQWQKISIKI